MLSLESASCPCHLPPFCFLSLGNTEINIGYLLGVVKGSQEVGKAGPCSPAICRCVPQIQMALHYLGPQFGFVTLQACGGSVIVFYGYEWHSLEMLPLLFPCATRRHQSKSPLHTTFFSCVSHSERTKRGKGIKEQTNSGGNGGVAGGYRGNYLIQRGK